MAVVFVVDGASRRIDSLRCLGQELMIILFESIVLLNYYSSPFSEVLAALRVCCRWRLG